MYNLSTDFSIIKKFPEFARMDPHCHTIYSDGCWTVEDLVKKAKKVGYRVVMKADHNHTRGNQKLMRLAKENGLVGIPGIEISAKKSHIVGIGINDWPYGMGLPIEECIERIHEQNGLAILAHPWWKIGVHDAVFNYHQCDGFEALNHSSPIGSFNFVRNYYLNPKYPEINHHNLPCWVGSDSHAGVVYGQYQMIIQTTSLNYDDLMETMRKRKVLAVGPYLNLLGLIADGIVNQPIQLRNELFYKKRKSYEYEVM